MSESLLLKKKKKYIGKFISFERFLSDCCHEIFEILLTVSCFDQLSNLIILTFSQNRYIKFYLANHSSIFNS